MDKCKISFEEGFNYANEINAIFGETSAKNNIGIDNIINDIMTRFNFRNENNENFKIKKCSSKKKKNKRRFC